MLRSGQLNQAIKADIEAGSDVVKEWEPRQLLIRFQPATRSLVLAPGMASVE
jgi:hypothetical protein